MGLAAFIQQYVKPSRWWRRQKTIEVVIWPRFLAQWLCPHNYKQMIMFSVEEKTKTSMCLDCHKHVLERNDCAHAEVHGHMYETEGTRLVPRSYVCDHCGVELAQKDLPTGVRVAHLNIEAR
jgi:hypothetical protein